MTIQKVLRHSQLSTTARYVHIPTEVTRAAVNRVESAIEETRKKQREKQEAEEQQRKAAAQANLEILQSQSEMVQ